MRRPRPRFWAWTLTLTAALLAVVWVGSMRVVVGVAVPPCTVHLHGGAFTFERITSTAPRVPDRWIYVRDQWHAAWWFSHVNAPLPSGGTIDFWLFPLWPFVFLTGVPGVWMMVKTRNRTNPNACPACGYDRTGLPQTSTGPAPCPECGKGKDDDAVKG